MSILGPSDLKQFLLPLGWDASEMLKWKLADGVTYEEIVNDIVTGLSMLNESLLVDPHYGGLFSMTSELGVEYLNGDGVSGMTERTEYQRADPRRGTTIGHMLPIKSYDRTLGWTWDFLRRARRIQIDATIKPFFYDVKDNFQRKLLTRFFSNAENTIATGGYDVPFIKGGGTVSYVPPPFEGQLFQSTHSHFERKGTSNQADALNSGAYHLHEHGIMGPYTAIIPRTDVATYRALAGWVLPFRNINYVRTDSAMPYGYMQMEDRFIGAYETDYGTVFCWDTNRLPTNYIGIYKEYGRNDARNPLAVRYSPDLGFGAVLVRGQQRVEYPLENATPIHEFGVGTGVDRLNGYACFFAASGNYVVPTIS